MVLWQRTKTLKYLVYLIVLTAIFSCSKKGSGDTSEEIVQAPHQLISAPASESKEPVEEQAPKPAYVSTGDIQDIKDHGVLRILIPRFDVAEALPRDGLPVFDYQALAEQLALEQALQLETVYVDGFDELIPALLDGKADLIVTNLTKSKKRAEVVAFSRSITQVDEWLIAPKDSPVSELKDVSDISIQKGTVYFETLERLEFKGNIEVLPSSTSGDDLFRGLEFGKYKAGIADSDIARVLLQAYPSLEKKIKLRKNRRIAWAARKDNPELLAIVNKFLVSHFVSRSQNKKELFDWPEIKARGKIRLLTLNNPASYFMYRGELMGFDYELVKKFATDNDLHLAIVIKDSIPELFQALQEGEGDVIVASLSRSSEREAMGLVFSRPYMKVKEQVAGRSDGPKLESLENLSNYKVGVNPSTVFYQRLKGLSSLEPPPKLVEYPNDSTENILAHLREGDIDFTFADSHLLAIEKTWKENVEAKLSLESEAELVWMMRPDQKVLLENSNKFIKKRYRGLFYNVVWKKYFENEKKIARYQGGRVSSDGNLSAYDDLVQREAKKYSMDWRLLVSQMYQESRFNPGAKSFAGAQGLMQVLPRTGRELGYTDLYDPENGIAAGVAYMHWLEDRFPGEIPIDEKTYFMLAAYNAGAGHVRDARKLATELGLDRNIWFANVEKAMLLLSKPEYYKKARFGYVRGSEPVNYVREIRERYLAYLKL